jgi:hypothetical protein
MDCATSSVFKNINSCFLHVCVIILYVIKSLILPAENLIYVYDVDLLCGESDDDEGTSLLEPSFSRVRFAGSEIGALFGEINTEMTLSIDQLETLMDAMTNNKFCFVRCLHDDDQLIFKKKYIKYFNYYGIRG